MDSGNVFSSGEPRTICKLPSPPTCFYFHGECIVTAHKSGEIVSFDTKTQEKKRVLKHTRSVTSMLFTEGVLLFGTRKGEIRAYLNGQSHRLPSRHAAQVVSIIEVSSESGEKEIVTSSTDGRICMWRLVITEKKRNGETSASVSLLYVKTLYGPTTPISCTEASVSTLFLLCSAEISNTVRVFKLQKDTQLLFDLPRGEHAVRSTFLSEEVFCVASSSNNIYIYDMSQVTPVSKLRSKHLVPDTGFPVVYLKSVTKEGFENGADPAALLVAGFASGSVFLIRYSNRNLSVIRKIDQASILVSAGIYSGSLLLLMGREEPQARFHLKPEGANELLQL